MNLLRSVMILFASAALLGAPALARSAPIREVRILTPAYTLTCVPSFAHKRVVLDCVPSRTPRATARAAFGNWRYGDPLPFAIFAQTAPIGNGGPALCDNTSTQCPNGAVSINYANPSPWTALLTNTAQIQALGAGGVNACAGVNFPATNFGYCAGANNGTTNIYGLTFGPQATTFACTSTCTVGDSVRMSFYDSTASGAGGRGCDFWKVQASASLESSCGMIAAGSAGVQTSILRNQVSSDWNGTCASVAAGPHCVTAVRSGQTESGLTCFQLDVTNHALAVDTGVTLSNAAAYTFTSTIPNGFVGSTSTASATTDTVTWFCFKP